MHQFRIAPLLLRGRIRAGTGLIDLLAVLAFTVSSWLLLSVLAGINAFVNRQFHPPAAFVAALGADATEGVAELVMWTLLAACAGVLLIVPLVTLGAAAARMGALGRDQRLSTLRLLGLTGGQAIDIVASLRGDRDAARIAHYVERFDLDPSKKARSYSKGNRQKVALVAALASRAELLIFDEPTSGLDPLTSRLVDDLIEEMRQRFGVTSIVISHDIASCFRIGHQAVLLIKGRIEACGPPDELLVGGSEIAREFIRNSAVDVDSVGRVSR